MNIDESLPRKNGELVFNAPWEGRVFGLALAACENGAYPWKEFSAQLAEAIARDPEDAYYARWLEAFEALLTGSGILSVAELRQRADEYRSLERDPVF